MDKPLANFHQAIRQHPAAIAELNPRTYVRYLRGEFPKGLGWLMQHPVLLRALADDAEARQQREQHDEVAA